MPIPFKYYMPIPLKYYTQFPLKYYLLIPLNTICRSRTLITFTEPDVQNDD